jgi:uncharacterized membrane protein HdeD (DUF308 family)
MDSPTAKPVPAESFSQAGAGGLLSAVGIVELVLGFGAAGWPYWAAAAAIALIGAVLLVRGVAAIHAAPQSPRLVPETRPPDEVGTMPAVPHLR